MPSRTLRAHAPRNTLEHHCNEFGLRMTPMRREVLEELLEGGLPQTAYQLIAAMERRLSRRILPPTIYRALSFLQEHGFVSRLESRNAFVAFPEQSSSNCRLFFICDTCGSTTESGHPDLEAILGAHAEARSFIVRRQVMEVEGTCGSCAESPPPEDLHPIYNLAKDVT